MAWATRAPVKPAVEKSSRNPQISTNLLTIIDLREGQNLAFLLD